MKTKCSGCRKEFEPTKTKSNGDLYKSCENCIIKNNKKNKLRCPCGSNKQPAECRVCKDAVKITIQRFIKGSRYSDKLTNRFDIVNFMDRDFLKLLIEESDYKCCYCECELELIHYGANLMSIERINNSIGHIKSNVKIACLKCNLSKVGNVTLEQIKQTELI